MKWELGIKTHASEMRERGTFYLVFDFGNFCLVLRIEKYEHDKRLYWGHGK
jgi:hypothetical protein